MDDSQQASSHMDLTPSVDETMSKVETPASGPLGPHSNSRPRGHKDTTSQQEDAVASTQQQLSDANPSNIICSLESKGTEAPGRKGAVKDTQGSDPGLPTSPKHARKARKPDREIYQAGGRRVKGAKDSGPNSKDFEKGAVDVEPSGPCIEMEKGSKEAESGHKDGCDRRETEAAGKPQDREESRGSAEPQGKGRDERAKGRRSKDANRKQEHGKQGRKDGGPSGGASHDDLPCVDALTSKVERLSMGDGPRAEAEGKRGGDGEEGRNRRRRSGNDGRKSRTSGGGAAEVTSMPEGSSKKKERGGRRSRGGGGAAAAAEAERTSQSESAKKESVETEKERSSEKVPESDTPRQAKSRDKQQHRDSDRPQPRDNNRSKKKDVEADRGTEDGDRNKSNRTKAATASKRYSKSDIRRARNRTCSTSSASSCTSLDGPLEFSRRRAPPDNLPARDRTETGSKPSAPPGSANRAVREKRDGGGGRPNANHRRRQTNRDVSSSDSLDDFAWEKGPSRRSRASDEDWSPERTPERSGRGQRGGSVGGRGGILRVAVDRHQTGSSSRATAVPVSGEDQPGRRQSEGPRGRGRGILVLPAHTDLTRSPEPGPKLFGGARWSRGRGGRGGGTRRLWDPNNPDQKPALAARSQQLSQHGAAQHPLYMLPHGSAYGPLHFHDTDDEVAGSPPVHKGAHPASSMAFYKFQNSDNPYCYPVPTDTSGTPPRYPYPYPVPYSGDLYPSPPFYSSYGPGGQGGFIPSGPPLSPEEAEEQARGELGRLLRAALNQESQLSNLLSRDHISPDGLDRMAQLRSVLKNKLAFVKYTTTIIY